MPGPMKGRPRTRTFTSLVLRVLVPRALLFGAGAAMLVLGQAMAVSPSAHSSSLPDEEVVSAPPSWTAADAAAYPGCVPLVSWPAAAPADFVVVHSFRADAHRKVAFDAAWAANHDDTEANDVWVLGVCATG
jgi:hypothetical protein